MADPFLGEIRLFAFNFAPYGWAVCNGQLLPISQYSALFSLLGTYYGGNGTSNFALPNLQGRVPLGAGDSPGDTTYVMGETGGLETVTLNSNDMPSHNHALNGISGTGNDKRPLPGSAFAQSSGANYYAASVSNLTTLNSNTVTSVGGGLTHNNLQPYLVMNFCIAMAGVFPTRN